VIQLLTETELGDNAKRAVEARALLRSLNFGFVLVLVFTAEILGKTQSLSSMLQSVDINFSSVIALINVVHADLTELRSVENCCSSYTDEKHLFETAGIAVDSGDQSDNATTQLAEDVCLQNLLTVLFWKLLVTGQIQTPKMASKQFFSFLF